MRCLEIPLSYRNPLVNDYLTNFDKLKDLYSYDPFQVESFAQRCRYLDQRPYNRAELSEVLREYNLNLGAGPETLANIELLAAPDSCAVITGQQAGLLGGPLYTVYKALTTVQLAQSMSKQLQRPVIPVFWIAAEDHDFVEVNELNLLDRQGQETTLKLNYVPDGRYSVGDISVPGQYRDLLEDVKGITPDTEFKQAVLDFIQTAAGKSANLADWFGRVMLNWLGSLGLVMVNPLNPKLRKIETGLFEAVALRYAEVNGLLAKSVDNLVARKYPVAVEKEKDNVNLFFYANGERIALLGSEQGYSLRGRPETFSRQELTGLIKNQPEKFSPNVVIRPLTQEVLFPTLAYVGGPGEVNYFGQFKGIFELFDMAMPVIFPRANLTLVEGFAESYLDKYALNLEDLLYRSESIAKNYLEAQDNVGIDRMFAALSEDITAAYENIMPQLSKVDAGLGRLGEENRERILSQVEWLKGKTLQAHRKNNEVFIRQFKKLCSSLAPEGQLQERRLGGVYFVLKYGPRFFQALSSLDLTANSRHKMVYLK